MDKQRWMDNLANNNIYKYMKSSTTTFKLRFVGHRASRRATASRALAMTARTSISIGWSSTWSLTSFDLWQLFHECLRRPCVPTGCWKTFQTYDRVRWFSCFVVDGVQTLETNRSWLYMVLKGRQLWGGSPSRRARAATSWPRRPTSNVCIYECHACMYVCMHVCYVCM